MSMNKIKKSFCLALGAMMIFSSTLTSQAATQIGTYPTRRGVILVTPDPYMNLIPTGHAAIVWDKQNVIESLSNGVGDSYLMEYDFGVIYTAEYKNKSQISFLMKKWKK